MKVRIAVAIAIVVSLMVTDVSAQTRSKRVFDLVRNKVEDKAKERLAHEMGIDDPTSPANVEVDPEISTRHRIGWPRVRHDPIGVAQVATMHHNESLPKGRFYPEDPSFIPSILEGYTHVRRGSGQWLPGSHSGISTCDPNYILLAKAGKTVPFEDVPSDCLRKEGQIVGGRKLPKPDQFDAMNASATREEVVAAYQERIAALSATDKYYFRGVGPWLSVDGGVVAHISSQNFTNLLGLIEGPNALSTDYRVGTHIINQSSLAFFIPLTAEEKQSQSGVKWNATSNYFNPNWSTIFYRVTGARPCTSGRYLVNVVVDEVRYHLGRDASAPYRSWKPGSEHTLPNGLPKNARPSGHPMTPEQLCPPLVG